MSRSSNSHTGSGSTYVVTSALPYANGDIHLGHLVETVQTDVFVRFMKLSGNRVVYVCADDTHGTPIELSAIKRGITPEQLVEEARTNHVRDYASFSIGFDIFYTTNSPENRYYAEYIFEKLKEKELVVERTVKQFFCDHDKRFLPDRFIVGACPRCDAQEQYGDVCETCGATYEPTELKTPQCILCRNVPELKESTHFFVELGKREEFLREYLNSQGVLQDDMRNFVMHWIDQGLREWCISRDGPYFGFKIPGTENKFFYVWLDAPIGYLSSTRKWCDERGEDITDFWGKENDAKVVHFIGKDIVYFHALFWPIMLDAAEFKIPHKIFVHGFLTVQGEKMSKTRGTFILARDFVEKMKHPQACEYLRFYYAAKLSNNASDIDLNLDEFCNKINTTLVNNIGNFHHRTFVFLDRFYESKVPDEDWDPEIAAKVEEASREIAAYYENGEFRSAVEKIHALGSIGNKYYQDAKPWELVKNDKNAADRVMVTCVNLARSLAVFLKPITPNLVAKVEQRFDTEFTWNDALFSLRNGKVGKAEKLTEPITAADFEGLMKADEETKTAAGSEFKVKEFREEIGIEDFSKIDLRIGHVVSAERVKKSKKLLKLEVNDGIRTRQIIAGLGQTYTPEDLTDRQVVFVANLKPAKLMGRLSEGMILAAEDSEGLKVLMPDKISTPGAQVS